MPNTSSTGGVLAPALPFPVDDDAIDTVLQALMVQVTGLDGTLVRPRWQAVPQKQPEAQVNWCAIGITADVPNDGPSFAFDGTHMQLNLTRHEDITAMATFYGPLAKTYAAIARDGLSIPQNLDALDAVGIKLIATGAITAAHELLNLTWVRRRDMSLALRRIVNRAYPVNSLLSAPVHLLDDTVVDLNFNVPPGTP